MLEKERQRGDTRAGDVLQKLREDILKCELKPGEKLRFEALRDRYEVSFSTLREALVRLASENLVTSEGQRGFEVATVSVDDLVDLTNARVLLERESLRLSMRNGDDVWEAEILASFYHMDRLQTRLGEHYYFDGGWMVAHSRFHDALVRASGSPVLLEMRRGLFERAHRYRRMSSQFRTQWRPKDVEHKTIMDAALERDEVALDLIERHIRETTENVLEFAGHLFRNAVEEAPFPITKKTMSKPRRAIAKIT